jgi:hypothetical protein
VDVKEPLQYRARYLAGYPGQRAAQGTLVAGTDGISFVRKRMTKFSIPFTSIVSVSTADSTQMYGITWGNRIDTPFGPIYDDEKRFVVVVCSIQEQECNVRFGFTDYLAAANVVRVCAKQR